MRVELVETTGDARCRLQWRRGTGSYANVPQANLFTHARVMGYSFTRTDATTGSVAITPAGGHTLAAGNMATLFFSSGNLQNPSRSPNYSGDFTVASVATTVSFTIPVSGTNLPASGTGNGYLTDSSSATTGWFNQTYPNTTFAGTPGRIGVDAGMSSVFGTGTPDNTLINPDNFSVRWTGQVQPQFSEEYTFVINADDNAGLRINGQIQTMRVATTSGVNASSYAYTNSDRKMVVTHGSIPAGAFVAGEFVRLDPTGGSLAALSFADYPVTAVSTNTFTIIIPGAGVYADQAAGAGLTLEAPNKALNDFAFLTSERFVRIPMTGGVRYDIQVDYFEASQSARCQLFWYSPSQPRQIIPPERLYPSPVPQAPAANLSGTAATALVGGPFSHALKGSNGSVLTVSGLPAWLTFSAGLLSGTPPPGAGGDYQIIVTTASAAGTGTSLLNLRVEDTGRSIGRDYWTSLPGTNVSAIPITTTPSGIANLTSLEAPTDFGDNYGTRIRGYLTAPATGNYYFWISASDTAELWISNDDDPINSFKRAWVNTGTPAPRSWNAELERKSPWLALEQGKRYYLEILHKAGAGSGDNLAAGWLLPGGTGNSPAEVVPGYVLSPYVAPAPGSTPGTLYLSTMLAQNGAVTNGVGNSTLRVSDDGNSAIMTCNHNGLSGPIVSQHIHTDPWLTHPSTIVFDIDTPVTPGDGLQPDGSYKWTILPVGTLTQADIVEIIKQGKAYINLHTALYPAGEIRGNYTAANGSRSFSPPPLPPAWTDDHTTNAGAARFLTQATFGPNPADINALKAMVVKP